LGFALSMKHWLALLSGQLTGFFAYLTERYSLRKTWHKSANLHEEISSISHIPMPKNWWILTVSEVGTLSNLSAPDQCVLLLWCFAAMAQCTYAATCTRWVVSCQTCTQDRRLATSNWNSLIGRTNACKFSLWCIGFLLWLVREKTGLMLRKKTVTVVSVSLWRDL